MSISIQSYLSLGILATDCAQGVPTGDESFYRKLIREGRLLGLTVFVFTPTLIDWEQATTRGFTCLPECGGFIEINFPLPGLVYDRCFNRDAAGYRLYKYTVSRLRNTPGLRFLGAGVKGKWEVYQLLKEDEQISSILPQTIRYRNLTQLLRPLDRGKILFFKPDGGSQGKGAVRILKDKKGFYYLTGKNTENKSFSHWFHTETDFSSFVRTFAGRKPYLIQPDLNLTASEGIPFDIRSLMQKNEHGHWELTGMAVRTGEPGSPTSNLHGGGKAREVLPFLTAHFGKYKARQLAKDVAGYSWRIAAVLEKKRGRMAELGIDFGISPDSRIWLLEVNSKPGRSAFRQLGNPKIFRKAVANPVRYAACLARHSRGQQQVPLPPCSITTVPLDQPEWDNRHLV
ncbi:YheC/YheD family protein [Paenibacillus larvae]